MQSEWVGDDDAFERLCSQLQEAPWLALDTEFHREVTYYAEFCLLQIASPSLIALVDVLNIANLEPLRDLLISPGVTVVFHAGFQDLEIIHQRFGILPAAVFDTQLAAAMLGWSEQIGYGSLVERLFGKVLSKGGARTNWRQRPLTPEQTEYAADDVRFLGEVFSQQLRLLRAQGKESWYTEEVARRYRPSQFVVDPDQVWKSVSGRKFLKPQQLPVLQAVAAWRENLARTCNLPRRWVLDDNALITVARTAPTSEVALTKLGVLKPQFIDDHGEEFIEVITQALDVVINWDEWEQPYFQALTVQQKDKLALITAQVRDLAVQLQIAPALLATRAELEAVVRGRVDVFSGSAWRQQLLLSIIENAAGATQ